MKQITMFLVALGLLMMWTDIKPVRGGHAPLFPEESKQIGRRMERQINLGSQKQPPPPAPGPAGYVYKLPNCNCQATTQFLPVCGSNGFTYRNRQLLECAASCGENVKLRRSGPCGGGLSTVMQRQT